MDLTPEQRKKQQYYRDARFTEQYDHIWQSVGKCVFCDLRDKYIFFEEHGVVMHISLYAYIDGHLLITPRRHVRSPRELTQLEWDAIRKFSYIAKKIIKDVHGVNGMQLVQKEGASAQSTVDQHLHFHCIPFDAPDLCTWNYRKLKHTPLENVALYKKDRKKIIEHSLKYDKKYRQPAGLRVVADLLMINTSQEVLFQHRAEGVKFSPDYLTVPGGGIENYHRGIEAELAREVLEETAVVIDTSKISLLASRIQTMKLARSSAPLHVKYTSDTQFLWNTYILRDVPVDIATTPGDDCERLEWIPRAAIADHPRISPEIKQLIGSLPL